MTKPVTQPRAQSLKLPIRNLLRAISLNRHRQRSRRRPSDSKVLFLKLHQPIQIETEVLLNSLHIAECAWDATLQILQDKLVALSGNLHRDNISRDLQKVRAYNFDCLQQTGLTESTISIQKIICLSELVACQQTEDASQLIIEVFCVVSKPFSCAEISTGQVFAGARNFFATVVEQLQKRVDRPPYLQPICPKGEVQEVLVPPLRPIISSAHFPYGRVGSSDCSKAGDQRLIIIEDFCETFLVSANERGRKNAHKQGETEANGKGCNCISFHSRLPTNVQTHSIAAYTFTVHIANIDQLARAA
jgi:hypothetical protein